MRNVFDQYQGAENRLTHALLTVLAEDRALLRTFLRDLCGLSCPKPGSCQVFGQRLPGQPEPSEDEAERRGLPDVCIIDDNDRCVLIEAKVESDFTSGQVDRHRRTLERIGYDDVSIIGITGRHEPKRVDGLLKVLSWQDVYTWLVAHGQRGSWALRAASFMEVMEERMVANGQLRGAALTRFSGIPFGLDHPYTYREARRLIGLIMKELRGDKALIQVLGMNPAVPGRPAITGRDQRRVWDFLSLAKTASANFTSNPHLTLGLHDDDFRALVTIPNGVSNSVKINMRTLGVEGFRSVISEVTSRMLKVRGWEDGMQPWFIGVQRHFKSQRSPGIVDAKLEFDLRTAVSIRRTAVRRAIKAQPRWLDAAYDAFVAKSGNYQIQVGARIPYGSSDLVRSSSCVQLVRDLWLACEPFVRAARG